METSELLNLEDGNFPIPESMYEVTGYPRFSEIENLQINSPHHALYVFETLDCQPFFIMCWGN